MSEPSATLQWVKVASFGDALTARIASGRLESENIPVVLLNEHFVSANWMMSTAVGGVQLAVPAEVAERAGEILKQHAAGEFDLDEFEAPACPHCGHQQWERHTRGRHVAMAVLFMTSVPLPFLGDQWRCVHCGKPLA